MNEEAQRSEKEIDALDHENSRKLKELEKQVETRIEGRNAMIKEFNTKLIEAYAIEPKKIGNVSAAFFLIGMFIAHLLGL